MKASSKKHYVCKKVGSGELFSAYTNLVSCYIVNSSGTTILHLCCYLRNMANHEGTSIYWFGLKGPTIFWIKRYKYSHEINLSFLCGW